MLIFAQFFLPVFEKIPQTPFLNSKVTEPIFTKFQHDVEALVPRLMRALTKLYCSCFGTSEQRVKTFNLDVCKKNPK